MKSYALLLIVFLSLASACSSGEGPRDDYNQVPRPISSTPGSGEPTYLATTRGTRSLISPTRQFVSYITAAKRLTVIDQATESEVNSIKYAGLVTTAFPIASFDGIGILNPDGLTVFSGGAQRSFSFPYTRLAWDMASAAAAFAFATGNGSHVIRYLEGDQWQSEPLAGLNASTAEIPLWRADGLAMISIRPADGNYALYRASQANAPLTLSHTCDLGTTAPTTLPLVALVVQGSHLLWGNQRGELGAIDLDETACQALRPLVTLPNAGEIARIVPRTDNSILVVALGGQVYDWDGGNTINNFRTLDACDFAFAAVPLADDELVALCLNDLAQPVQTDQIKYRIASYRYFPASRPGISFASVTSLDDLDQVAVDVPSKRVFFFDVAALGRLTVIDLTTNQSRERKGLFVKNILNR